MGITYVYEDPSTPPAESEHWKSLNHRSEEQKDDRLIHTLEELKTEFRSAISNCSNDSTNAAAAANNSKNGGKTLALWSCIFGYCEALVTHKNPHARFQLYPIPIDALSRLVEAEFVDSLRSYVAQQQQPNSHRQAAQAVSNFVWSRVVSKKNVKDEQHANSLYVCLRGKTVDKRGLDCFGAALCTVIGLQCLGYHTSMLTLSEDHAYESHVGENHFNHERQKLKTCEVAIPGNTKASQTKRGREIAETFQQKTTTGTNAITPETSWLYMGKCPVLCSSVPMTLAAALANINCSIETTKDKNSETQQKMSGPLLEMKRELLWILKDGGHLKTFPFALIELGDCEEHCTSARGEAWVQLEEGPSNYSIMAMEGLYHEAIRVCRTKYDNGQVYPYCYAGHYHKDGGQRDDKKNGTTDNEYRLVEALRNYSEASRVASKYVYEWGDSLQLTKVMVKLSDAVINDIFMEENSQPRVWISRDNQVAAGTWLVAFFDALLLWEERSGGTQFLPTLKAKHPSGIGKMFSILPHDVRNAVFDKIILSSSETDAVIPSRPIMSSHDLHYFTTPTSKRLVPNGLLWKALTKAKVSVGDMDLAIVVQEEESSDNRGRRSKRARRSGSKLG